MPGSAFDRAWHLRWSAGAAEAAACLPETVTAGYWRVSEPGPHRNWHRLSNEQCARCSRDKRQRNGLYRSRGSFCQQGLGSDLHPCSDQGPTPAVSILRVGPFCAPAAVAAGLDYSKPPTRRTIPGVLAARAGHLVAELPEQLVD